MLVVSGDLTPVFYLTDDVPNTQTTGNRRFFTNILDAGEQVVVLATSNNTSASEELHMFYEALPGVHATLVSGEIGPGDLATTDLLVAPAPDDPFTAAEISAIGQLLDRGGNVFVAGEASQIHFGITANSAVNGMLASLGIGSVLVDQSLDVGSRVAHGSQIVPNRFTSGAETLNYGFTSVVAGGTPLFLTESGHVFMSYIVPEPSSLRWSVLAAAFLTVFHSIRRLA